MFLILVYHCIIKGNSLHEYCILYLIRQITSFTPCTHAYGCDAVTVSKHSSVFSMLNIKLNKIVKNIYIIKNWSVYIVYIIINACLYIYMIINACSRQRIMLIYE